MNNLSLLQEALFNIKKLKQEVSEVGRYQPIAIVGLSCRFPSAPNKYAFWKLLEDGQNVISRLPKHRLSLLKGSREHDLLHVDFPYWGGYLSDIELFDPYFFGISPREAQLMDPQQRLLLEVTYEAIEDAGFSIDKIAGSNTGVFIGMYGSEFFALQNLESDLDALYLPTGNATCMASNRLSYQFDLHGPSLTLDTACSSSLVAIHQACKSLQNKECKLAIVGSVKINLLPSLNYILAKAKMLSPDGQCRTFDAHANGYVQGEGVGVIILKPLQHAIQDRDRIYAVIAGSVVNQDGKTNGLTAPNGLQQEALLKSAYSMSGIDPADVGYIECHGTGTALGDPIEIEALENVIGKAHHKKHCWISSVKTNIGHLEPAAGIASLIKVALCLQRSKVPPHINFSEPNPHIPFSKYHFQIPQQVENWPLYGKFLAAGISSFGFGGTNSHLVVRGLSEQEMSLLENHNIITEPKAEIFTLSAKDLGALNQLVKNWCEYFRDKQFLDLSSICYNLHVRRTHYPDRLAIIAKTTKELYDSLVLLQSQSWESATNIFLKKDELDSCANLELSNPQELELSELAKLYVNKGNIDWTKYEQSRRYAPIDMPLYPWQHKVYWPNFSTKPNPITNTRNGQFDQMALISDKQLLMHPLEAQQLDTESKDKLQFKFTFDINNLSELTDTNNIIHSGYYFEMLSFVTQKITKQNKFSVKDLIFLLPLFISNDEPTITIQLAFSRSTDNEWSFKIHKYKQGEKDANIVYAEGVLIWGSNSVPKVGSLASIKNGCSLQKGDEDTFTNRIKLMGMPIGPSIRWTDSFQLGKKTIIAKFRAPHLQEKVERFCLKLHPGIFDGCIQPLFMLLDKSISTPYMASKINHLQYFGSNSGELFLVGKIREIMQGSKHFIGDWYLIDADENMVASCEGLKLTQLDKRTVSNFFSKILKPEDSQKIQLSNKNNGRVELLNFLREEAAFIFNMPIEDVSFDKSLQEMGMDSLMAIFFSEKIKQKVGITFPVEDLLKPINIEQISQFLLNLSQKNSTSEEKVEKEKNLTSNIKAQESNNNPYIPYVQHNRLAEIKLFCFPYGGAGASIYKDWQRYFPSNVEICPVQLPGRETLSDTKFVPNIKELIQLLYSNIAQEFTMPFAFFGHSFGSLIAFEFARYLKKLRLVLPKHLFVSAFPAPHLPKNTLADIINHLKQLPFDVWTTDSKVLTNEQLNMLMDQFSKIIKIDKRSSGFENEYLRAFLPRYLNDISLVEKYSYIKTPLLNVPITAFYSTDDKLLINENMMLWKHYTKSKFKAIKIDGGHLFIDEEGGRTNVCNTIITELGIVANRSCQAERTPMAADV